MNGREPTRRAREVAGRMPVVLELLDELTELAEAGEGLRRRVEQVMGLRAGELRVLVAVSRGAAHPRAVAGETGQADEAAGATLEALVHRGLLSRHGHRNSPAGGAEPTLLRVTDAGLVLLQQAEGLQIRILDAVVLALGDEGAGSLRHTVQALGEALTGDGDVAGPGHGRPLVGTSAG